jgi:hypothetical protein
MAVLLVLLLLTLASLTTATTTLDAAATDHEIVSEQQQQHLRKTSATFMVSQQQQHGSRQELQLFNKEPQANNLGNLGDLTVLLNAACCIVSTLISLTLVQCQCGLESGLEFVCATRNPVCLGGAAAGFCSTPSILGGFSLVNQFVDFEFCLNEATLGGEALPGLCIQVGGNLGNSTRSDLSAVDDTSTAAAAVLTECVATADGTDCNNCQLCSHSGSGDQGYTFDCTNVDARLIQSTCTPLSVITSLSSDQNIAFLPQLDSM